MPEILTKHPDIVIKLLQEHGIKCSSGEEQKILTKCPADSFCALKSGELCVYGADQFSNMTQITAEDLGIEIHPKHNLYSYGIAFMAGFLVACLVVKRMQKKSYI